MKKIALIEDRYKRQNDFLTQNNINLDDYKNILDNFIHHKAADILDQIFHDNFSFEKYDIIICHKSVENNTVVLSNLQKYCRKHDKTLVLFSGGISVNYYDNSEYELLELNSQALYSSNLKLFLEAVKNEDEDILMLCYGKNWKLNIVSNILEKTNYLIGQVDDNKILYKQFADFVDIEKLSKLEYNFYNIAHKNETTIDEITKFRDSLLEYFTVSNSNEDQTSQKKNISIHYDNIIDIAFDDDIKFNGDDNIDKYISSYIIKEELQEKEFDRIFIKDNLSSNYLELYGLRVAYHIRLSNELGNKRFIPIVIISDFDEATLNRFAHEANILFTEGIYLCKNTIEDIKKHQSLKLKNLSDYDNFINSIEVSSPKDTSGSHDIANKWSIYRWAKFLGAKGDVIDKNRSEVENELYFKYLVALNPSIETYINNQEIVKNNSSQSSGIKVVKKVEKKLQKILYIDDEHAKGWEDIFKSFFEKKHKQEFQFTTLHEIQKDTTYDEIKNYMLDYIEKDVPDLIILDMRLTKEDHREQNEKKLSGIKLLKYIKEDINPGIQVILLTASGKSKILNEANKYDILGYIKKEHPQDVITNTKDTFDTLKQLLNIGLEKQYLKDIWNIEQEIIKLNIFRDNKYNEIQLEIKSVFETLNTQMKNKFIYSMFAIFKILESLTKFYIEEKGDGSIRYAYWLNTNDKIPCVNDNNFLTNPSEKNDRTENKIRVLLHEKFNIKDKSIHDSISSLVKIRNNTIHPKNKKHSKNSKIVDKNDILKWSKVVYKILKNIES